MDTKLRRRLHQVLESGIGHDPGAVAVNALLIALILLTVAAVALFTVPEVAARHALAIETVETVAFAAFSIEYVLRLWAATEHPFSGAASGGMVARINHALRPALIVDLLALLPGILIFADPALEHDLDPFRAICFLKLGRYSPALQSLGRVLAAERSSLFGALFIMSSLLLVAGTGMYLIERHAQPTMFGTLPQALWWALVTLATVGYGDAYPATPAGKLFASVMILLGLAVYALPFAIIATGFAQETRRRDFLVTWTLVARVPLFSRLDADSVARIMTLLASRTYEPGDVIVREGERTEAMYFIADGEAAVELEQGEVRLGQGDFFGEIGLIERRPHGHNVTAATRCRVLVLQREDFERLGRRFPDLLTTVRETARQRSDMNRKST